MKPKQNIKNDFVFLEIGIMQRHDKSIVGHSIQKYLFSMGWRYIICRLLLLTLTLGIVGALMLVEKDQFLQEKNMQRTLFEQARLDILYVSNMGQCKIVQIRMIDYGGKTLSNQILIWSTFTFVVEDHKCRSTQYKISHVTLCNFELTKRMRVIAYI